MTYSVLSQVFFIDVCFWRPNRFLIKVHSSYLFNQGLQKSLLSISHPHKNMFRAKELEFSLNMTSLMCSSFHKGFTLYEPSRKVWFIGNSLPYSTCFLNHNLSCAKGPSPCKVNIVDFAVNTTVIQSSFTYRQRH